MSPYTITGPDAVKLLNYVTVNRDYAKLKVGGSRYAILCNEKGQILADGDIVRKEENMYWSFGLAPVLAYYMVLSFSQVSTTAALGILSLSAWLPLSPQFWPFTKE